MKKVTKIIRLILKLRAHLETLKKKASKFRNDESCRKVMHTRYVLSIGLVM